MPPSPDRRRQNPSGGRAGGAGGRGGAKPGGGAGRPGSSSGGRAGAKPAGSGGRAGSGRPRRDDDRRGSSTGSGRPRRDDDRRDRGDRERTDRGARGGAGSVPRPEGRAGAWGGLARRAAGAGGTAAPAARGRMADSPPSKAAEAFRAARAEERGEVVGIERVDDGDVRGAARSAVQRGTAPERTPARRQRNRSGPGPDAAALAAELGPVVGASTAPKLAARLADAGRAYEAERYTDARRILKLLADRAPASAAVRELHGLTLYRMGKWAEAVKELEAFRQLTGSTEQHPVLADAYRALRRYDEVEVLWRELREVSPSAELVAEGRIVYAGSLADRGDVPAALAAIEPAVRSLKAARKEHHLRLLYVLGDLYERLGDLPKARSTFDRIVRADAEFADAASRRLAL